MRQIDDGIDDDTDERWWCLGRDKPDAGRSARQDKYLTTRSEVEADRKSDDIAEGGEERGRCQQDEEVVDWQTGSLRMMIASASMYMCHRGRYI